MNNQSTDIVDEQDNGPTPEMLQTQSDDKSDASVVVSDDKAKSSDHLKHVTYRPSHKATFIGIAVVTVVLAVNAGVIYFLMRGQTEVDKALSDAVTINPEVLSSLGMNRTPVGNAGTELTIGPKTTFKGNVTVASDVSISGQLELNSKFTAQDASLTKLQAGETSIAQLTVNGDGTISTLNLRKDLNVVGSTRLQGPVNMSQLVTINNNLNVTGSLSVGGTLSVRNFQASSLTSDTTLTIGGHVITRGSAPNVGSGPAVGSNGTVSISGNDASGTVAINIGVGGGNGILANIAFKQQYTTTPHVVVTPVGRSAGDFYINRSVGGFSIGINSALGIGGYAFDYIVMQ